ncbi:MAG: ATP synthase F0 subunit C [Candidatus Babeliaceae bacterium]|nr:ATP synthase F0 subunit C [Candidatus Babeliaceae bacterium]
MEEFVSYVKIAALLGAAFAVAIGTMGPAISQGIVGSKACENVAKYPESSSKLFPVLISSLAIIETSSLAAVGVAAALIYYAFIA